MRIRACVAADLDRLETLRHADAALMGFVLHGVARAGPRWKRTLVAEDGDQLLGVATIGRNQAHPSLHTVVLDVAAGHRRRGIGRALLAALRELPDTRQPMVGKLWADDPAAVAFLAAEGGHVIQRQPGMAVDLRAPAVRRWAGAQVLPAGTTVCAGAEVPRARLTALWTDLYCWTHESWAPPNTRDVMATVFAEAVDALDLPATRIAVRGDRMVAVAFVVRHPAGLLVVAETATRDQPDGRELVAGLLGNTLGDLDSDQVTIDGHVTDPHLWAVASTIPHLTGRELLVGQLPP